MTRPISLPHFVCTPAAAPPWPGLVVLTEGSGVSPWLLRMCQRLAAEGYATVAPDMFWRHGGSDPATAVGLIGKLAPEDVLADITASAERLRALGASSVGVTGFCMGGGHAYLAAVSGVDVACAAPFYGIIDRQLGEPSCPVLIFFGGTDEYIPMASITKVEQHHPGKVVVYADAGHGFMRDGSDSYHEAAATDAWDRLLAFFAEHLR